MGENEIKTIACLKKKGKKKKNLIFSVLGYFKFISFISHNTVLSHMMARWNHVFSDLYFHVNILLFDREEGDNEVLLYINIFTVQIYYLLLLLYYDFAIFFVVSFIYCCQNDSI